MNSSSVAVFWCYLLRTGKLFCECQHQTAQCAAASPRMGLKPAPNCGTSTGGWSCGWWPRKRGKPSLRLVAATASVGRRGVGMNPSGLGVLGAAPTEGSGPWWGEVTAAACAHWGGEQCGKDELDVVVWSQGLTPLTAEGPEQSLGAEDLCIPSLRQSLAVHSQSQRALGSVLGLLR